MKPHYVGLIGDIGGTHARFALVDDTGHIRNPRTFMSAEYGGLNDVIAEYLEGTGAAVTSLAKGVPIGGELDYLDEGTISAAMAARKAL